MGYTVYKLISPSNKVYIGITCQPVKKRWAHGTGYKKCPAINKAIKKYGWDNFEKEILFENLTEEKAKKTEMSLIKSLKSDDKKYGYNLTAGGDGTAGRQFSEETRKRLSEINKGRVVTEEQKERIRKALLGKHPSEETKKKMSMQRKGNKNRLGKKLSEEEKRQISDRQKGANNQRAKKVICLETLKIYDTLTQAKQETGATKITECCRHYYKHKSSNGLHWEYYNESISLKEYKDILCRLTEERRLEVNYGNKSIC